MQMHPSKKKKCNQASTQLQIYLNWQWRHVSLSSIRWPFSSKTSAEVGCDNGMRLKMMARWWHSKCPSFEGLYAHVRNMPCSICVLESIRHMHFSHKATACQNVCQHTIYYQIQKELVILTLFPLMRNMSLYKSFFSFLFLLIKSFKQLINSFYRLENQTEFWIFYFTKTPGVNLSPESHFTWTIWLSCGVSEHTLDVNLK